jgi:hypothetical protein
VLILTYGPETLTRTKADFRRLTRAEMRFFGSTEGKTRREKNSQNNIE